MTRTLPLLLAACAYQAPLDPDAVLPGTVVQGEVLADGLTSPGPTVLLLSDVDDPMPPLGTGRPVKLGAVPAWAWSLSDDGAAVAGFTLTDVPDGTWLLTALLDQDHDFHPLVPTLAGATCGDRPGARIAGLGQPTLSPFTVQGPTLVQGLLVAMGAPLTTERPAFSLVEGADVIDPTQPLVLRSEGIEATYGDLSLSLAAPTSEPPNPCEAAFIVRIVDADDDGVPDPHPDYPPEAGVLDVWPRVYLSWLGEPTTEGGTPSYDRSADPRATWTTEALPYVDQLPALLADPQLLDALLNDALPTGQLVAATTGAFRRTAGDGSSVVITDPGEVPTGAWSVTVVLQSGQTWTVPNELDTSTPFAAALPPPGVTSASRESQGHFAVTLP